MSETTPNKLKTLLQFSLEEKGDKNLWCVGRPVRKFGSSIMCFVACRVKLSAEHISKCVGRDLTTHKIIQTIASATEMLRELSLSD
ncbi:hypothetical protein Tco_0251270 [Tanacetum coccineum]